MFRIMLRSFEGWRFSGSSAGSYWERREVWSTWDVGLSYEAARAAQDAFRVGGIRAAIVPEDGYDLFCNSHVIC